jgi:hypothetical protein
VFSWTRISATSEQVCNSDLTEKKAFLEARCSVAEARLAELAEKKARLAELAETHRRGVEERDRSIAALERRGAGGRLVVDALLLDDIQVRAGPGRCRPNRCGPSQGEGRVGSLAKVDARSPRIVC